MRRTFDSIFQALTWRLRKVLVIVALSFWFEVHIWRTVSLGFFVVFTEGQGDLVLTGFRHIPFDTAVSIQQSFTCQASSASTPKQDLEFQTEGMTIGSCYWDKPIVCFAEACQEPWWWRTVLVITGIEHGLIIGAASLEDFNDWSSPQAWFFLHQGKVSQKIWTIAHVIKTQKAKQFNVYNIPGKKKSSLSFIAHQNIFHLANCVSLKIAWNHVVWSEKRERKVL